MRLDWSGLDGVRVGQAIRQGRMDSDVADIMRRKQEESAGNYETDMGLDGAVGQAEGLRRQTDDFGVEGQKATIAALNANAMDTTPAASRAYTLGDHSRDTAYTPEEVKGLNRRDTRDMLVSKWGREGRQADKEMGAEDLQGIQTEVAKGQLDDYKKAKKLEADLGENSKGSHFGRATAADSAAMEEFTKKKALYDAMPPEVQAGVKPPVAPVPTKITPIQSLADAISEQAVKAKHGKHDINVVMSLTSTMDKLRDEGVKKAMLVADRTGDPQKIADAFNADGGEKIEAGSIKTKKVTLPDGTTTYEVTSTNPKTGETQTVNARSELESLISAEKNYDELNKKSDAFTKFQYDLALRREQNKGLVARGAAAKPPKELGKNSAGEMVFQAVDGSTYTLAIQQDEDGNATQVRVPADAKGLLKTGREKVGDEVDSEAKVKQLRLQKKADAAYEWTGGKAAAEKELADHIQAYGNLINTGKGLGPKAATPSKSAAPAGMPPGSVQYGGKWGKMKEGKFYAYKGQ